MNLIVATTTNKIVTESNSWNILISSFCGAFFAFLFVNLGDIVSRVGQRKKKHYDTLVRLEHIGNENLSTASNMIFVAEDIINTSNKTIESNNIYVNFNDFDSLTIKNELLIDLLNSEFINQCFVLNIHAKKINRSYESIGRFYKQINNGIFQKSIPLGVYYENLKEINGRLKKLINFTKDFVKENKKMIATVRVLMKYQKPPLSRVTQFMFKNIPLATIQLEINTSLKELEQQIEDGAKRSEKHIERIYNK